MIPSQWHFLRKVCSSDPRSHPDPAGSTSLEPKGMGAKGAWNEHKRGGDKTGYIAPCISTLVLNAPLRLSGIIGYKERFVLCFSQRLCVFMRMQHANLMHVIASPSGVWPKLLNNQWINLRKISFGLRGKPVLFSLNRRLKPYVRDQRYWPQFSGVEHMALPCVAEIL